MGYLTDNQALAETLALMSSHAATVGQVHILPFLNPKQVVSSLRWDLCEIFEELPPENLAYLEQQLPGFKQMVAALDVDDEDTLVDLVQFVQRQSPCPFLVQILLKQDVKDIRMAPDGQISHWTSENSRVIEFWILAKDLESIASQGAELGLKHLKTIAAA